MNQAQDVSYAEGSALLRAKRVNVIVTYVVEIIIDISHNQTTFNGAGFAFNLPKIRREIR